MYCPLCDKGKYLYPTVDARRTVSIREIGAGKDQRWKKEEKDHSFLNTALDK